MHACLDFRIYVPPAPQKAKTQTSQCQNFSLKIPSSEGGKGLLLLVVTPSSAPSRLGKQVNLHLGHFPPPTSIQSVSPLDS